MPARYDLSERYRFSINKKQFVVFIVGDFPSTGLQFLYDSFFYFNRFFFCRGDCLFAEERFVPLKSRCSR